jgi:hypothetical protein
MRQQLRSRRQLMAGSLDYAGTQNPGLDTPLKQRMASKINTNDKSLYDFYLIHIAHLLCLMSDQLALQGRVGCDNYRSNPRFVK